MSAGRVLFTCGGCGATGLRAEEVGAGRDGRPLCLPCVRGSRVRKAKALPGYYCPSCLAGGFAPDEMYVTQDGRALCLDCAHWVTR